MNPKLKAFCINMYLEDLSAEMLTKAFKNLKEKFKNDDPIYKVHAFFDARNNVMIFQISAWGSEWVKIREKIQFTAISRSA